MLLVNTNQELFNSIKPINVNGSKCLVRSHFDYAVSVWDPYKVKHITDIEDVQRRATKINSPN